MGVLAENKKNGGGCKEIYIIEVVIIGYVGALCDNVGGCDIYRE